MSPEPPDASAEAVGPRFWVIGGCWGDASRSWRRWSEVLGPYPDRDKAEAQWRRLQGIHAQDGRVHFELVRLDAHA